MSGAREEPELWCVGGGKGGIGKTVLTASLAFQLARVGRQVVLVDGDMGGANLHTMLGVAPPKVSLADFVSRRVGTLAEVAVETGVPRLRLISGASAFLASPDIRYSQKLRVLNRVRDLDVDVVLIDLGAGTSCGVVDFFLAADVPVMVVMPEPTSVENAYALLGAALQRRLRTLAGELGGRAALDAALARGGEKAARRPDLLLTELQTIDAVLAGQLRDALRAFAPRFVVNQARAEADGEIGEELVAVCERHLGLSPRYAGAVRHDDAVWQSVRRRKLFLADVPGCGAAEDVRLICRGLMRREPVDEVVTV